MTFKLCMNSTKFCAFENEILKREKNNYILSTYDTKDLGHFSQKFMNDCLTPRFVQQATNRMKYMA